MTLEDAIEEAEPIMSLEEALALKERAERELRAAAAIEKEDKESSYWFRSNLPDDLFLASRDGKAFWLMYHVGEYSDYQYMLIRSVEHWEEESREWRNAFFNPQGLWTHREVVEEDFIKESVKLNCGHTVGSHGQQTGPIRKCWCCQEEEEPPSIEEVERTMLVGGAS